MVVQGERRLAERTLAEPGTRLAAGTIDAFSQVASALPGALLASTGLVGAGAGAVLALVGFMAFALYQMVGITRSGQTLGKRWLGLRILRQDGRLPGFLHGWFLRNFVFVAAATLLPVIGAVAYFVVNPILMFGDRRRALHDMIADTKVVVASD
jgi:uncharacterized RDD family membrane protein YckC